MDCMGFLFPHNFLIFSIEFNKLQLQHSPVKTLVLAFVDIILTLIVLSLPVNIYSK